MPVFSHEVRWIIDGSLGTTGRDVEAWFRESRSSAKDGEGQPAEWPRWRSDRYLMVPRADDMGIKWREGQLQIKGREGAVGLQQFVSGIEGSTERWVKWSYQGKDIDRWFKGWFPRKIGAALGVIQVDKQRIQRRLQFPSSDQAIEVPVDTPMDRGLDVELARIRVNGSGTETHWTLGFEAFATVSTNHRQFVPVVSDFLEGFPGLPLTQRTSMSYPGWVRQLVKGA